MPNRISAVATASLAFALILLLLAGRGSAEPKKTHEECEIDYKVCPKGCNGPAGDLGERCRAACDVTLVSCHQQAPKKAKLSVSAQSWSTFVFGRAIMIDAWSWLTFAGLGAFHGLNPAMGWLFAVALGLHRQSRAIVMASLVPIAIGHAASVGLVAGLLVVAGTLVPSHPVRVGSGLLLLGWAAYHWRFAHRHRVRFGMQVGLWGLAAWSFLMATAHGAGLMLWPALVASCASTNSNEAAFATLFPAVLAGVGVHTLAMLLTTVFIAVLVYEWVGLSILRRTWLNVDLLWVLALLVTGGLLLSGMIG